MTAELPAAKRPFARMVLVCGAVAAAVVLPAAAASAHPLGNFTINHYDGLVLSPTGVVDHAVVDTAEIPTVVQRDAVNTDGGDVSDAERAAFAVQECATVAEQIEITVNGAHLTWKVGATAFSYRPGVAGLDTSRLVCELSVRADLSRASVIGFDDAYLSDRIGWREITASGDGMALHNPSVGSQSVSDELRSYPNDLLSSPLNQRSVRLSAAPGASTDSDASPVVAPVGWSARVLGEMTARLDELVGGSHLTLQVGLLAVLLSLVLGASHAALPGHGKTIMAAYMVGTRGTPRDAFLIGGTVTLAHTTGVLVLGALFSASATFAGESLLAVLGVVSGTMVAVIGIGLLRGALARGPLRLLPGHAADHAADHAHGPDHGAGHGHGHPAGHHHGPGHDHGDDHDQNGGLVSAGASQGGGSGSASGYNGSTAVATLASAERHQHGSVVDHVHQKADRGFRRLTLVGMGLAGGLVPSPSALVVLLGAIALGRTAFGILLVVGYGVGMAATLIAVGYVIARMPARMSRFQALLRRPLVARLVSNGPTLTACLVLVVGIGLAARSAAPLL